ncbi:MAG: enoyl-CoA hydratase/isomerase family protein [Acidimicrobiales bacterium]
MASTERLLIERNDGVVTVTLNRPHRKNAVPGAMWDDITAAFRDIADRRTDRVVILTGAGGDFCSGADLAGDGEAPPPDHDAHTLAAMRRVTAACIAIAECRSPRSPRSLGLPLVPG